MASSKNVSQIKPIDLSRSHAVGEIKKVVVSLSGNLIGIIRFDLPPMIEFIPSLGSHSPKNFLEGALLQPAANMAFRPSNHSESSGSEVVIVFGRGTNAARRWLLNSNGSMEISGIDIENAYALAWDPCGRFLAIGDDQGHIRVLEHVNNELQPFCEMQGPKRRVAQISVRHRSDSDYDLYYTDTSGDAWCVDLEKDATSLVPLPALCNTKDNKLPYDWQCNTLHIQPYYGQKGIVYTGEIEEQDPDSWDLEDTYWYPYVWFEKDGEFTRIHTHVGRIQHVQFLTNGNEICLIGASGIEIWNLDSFKRRKIWKQVEGYRVLNVHLDPKSKILCPLIVPINDIQQPLLAIDTSNAVITCGE